MTNKFRNCISNPELKNRLKKILNNDRAFRYVVDNADDNDDDDIFTGIEKFYEKKANDAFNTNKIKYLDECIHIPDKPTILDFGGANGKIADAISEKYNCKVNIVDVHDGSKLIKSNSIEYKQITDKLPFANNTFDIIASFMVLHHIEPKLRSIMADELYRCTKKYLVVQEHNYIANNSDGTSIANNSDGTSIANNSKDSTSIANNSDGTSIDISDILDILHGMYFLIYKTDDYDQTETFDKYVAWYMTQNDLDKLFKGKFKIVKRFTTNKLTNNFVTIYEKMSSKSTYTVNKKNKHLDVYQGGGDEPPIEIVDENANPSTPNLGGKDIDVKEKVDRIFNKVSECHFTKESSAICSPKHLVDKMVVFVKNKGVDINGKNVVSKMKDVLSCNSESCLLKNKEFREFVGEKIIDDILEKFFKAEGPATNFDLLSNFNIDDTLTQLQQKFTHKKFLHIPFQMRDFEKVGSELSTIDLSDKLRQGYKTFGTVLNTDYSTGRGIHWYCIYGEHLGDKIVIEYFNSSGRPPLPETQAWLQKTKHHLHKELKIPVEIKYTTGIQYQNDEHSCGVYCLAYLWARLEGIPFQWFKADNFNDEMMHKLRKNLFRWEV
jgi:hypothetical protein